MKPIDQTYKSLISEIKSKIQQAQIKAHIKVNEELLRLYYDLAQMIVAKQKESSWGDGVIEQISKDLKQEFPNMKGFSLRNIKYMKQWYLFWQKGQQVVAQIFQIPWGHNIVIITKCKNIDEALFYVNKILENGYSRAVLVHQMESNLYQRVGKAINNFDKHLPSPQSDLVKEQIKDPYCFDFLTMTEKYNEKELEDALVRHIKDFLLELGNGFAFLGQQYKLEIDGDEFFIDLLFYHIKLKCYVVVELKTVKFKPEFAGQLNFYVSAINKELKSKDDNPTIGILICKSKNNTVVEYALNNINNPIGISEYKLISQLPQEFKSSLPTIEEIEAQLKQIGDEK